MLVHYSRRKKIMTMDYIGSSSSQEQKLASQQIAQCIFKTKIFYSSLGKHHVAYYNASVVVVNIHL
jgi:hypothetical protein